MNKPGSRLSLLSKIFIFVDMKELMNYREKIAYWKSLFPEDEELMAYWEEVLKEEEAAELLPPRFFHKFRPSGDGLERVFDVLPEGRAIHRRLLEIYEATADSEDYYFIVRNPRPLTRVELERLAKAYLDTVIAMIKACRGYYDNDFLDDLEANPPALQLLEGVAPESHQDDDFSGSIYELKSEFISFIERDPEEKPQKVLSVSEFLALRKSLDYKPADEREDAEKSYYYSEALYQMACLYDIEHYVLWPWQKRSPLDDAFKVFIDLWKHGVEERMDMETNTLRFYAPALTD
jgi:hypothetical protein